MEWAARGPPPEKRLPTQHEVQRKPQLPILQVEQQAEQQRERLAEQLLEQLLELLVIQLGVQLATQVETQVAIQVQTQVPTQRKTQVRMRADLDREVLRGIRPMLRRTAGAAKLRYLFYFLTATDLRMSNATLCPLPSIRSPLKGREG